MKVISFNINGIRARIHQLTALIEKHQPDVVGLQEIKVDNPQFPVADVEALPSHRRPSAPRSFGFPVPVQPITLPARGPEADFPVLFVPS